MRQVACFGSLPPRWVTKSFSACGVITTLETWSTWSAVGNLTSRAGELRSAPSGGRMIGIGLRAREP